MTPIVVDRLAEFDRISLTSGHHEAGKGFCAMELAAYVAGERWSDHPRCVCPVIGSFMRSWNDALPSDADRDRILKPLIADLLDTKATRAVEVARSYLALDWLVRVQTPAGLNLRDDLKAYAVALQGLAPLIDTKSCTKAQPTIDAAWDAWDAAWDVAMATLAPTVLALQDSAVDLVRRMIQEGKS